MEPGTSDYRLYNSRITNSYIKLVKKKYSFVNLTEVLEYAGMKDYEIADESHWFTREQVIRFQEKLVQLTGNPKISREAGRYAASVDALGIFRQYILGFVGASHFFELWLTKTASNLTRSAIYSSERVGSNKVIIEVSPVGEGVERPFQCENRMGFMEAIVFMYTKKMPAVAHTECMFHGGKVCRYEVSWVNSLAVYLKRTCSIMTPLLVLFNAILLALRQWSYLETSLTVSLAIQLILVWAAGKEEKKELLSSLENTVEMKDTLIEQINLNYNNSQMTNEIGQGLGKHTNTEDILASLIKVMQKRLSYDRGMIFLANSDATRLVMQTGYGFTIDQMVRIKRQSFHLDRPGSKGVFVRAFREQRPFLVNNLDDITDSLSPRSLAFARKIGTVSFICCPIICDGKSVGVLAVDNVITKQQFVQCDLSLLLGIASVLGISIRNAELINGRVRVFKSIVQVLAASIDARDPLTSGHSEKVTEYSLGICRELGLAPEYCNVVRVAALLHDYGKLGVPDTILKKKGALTSEEYEVVKEHSGRTTEILSKVDFQGVYCEVPSIAGSHHEKLDGSGYPRGLKGEEIPLGARIIAVADYFEAVTAKRHYHEPIPAQEAFVLLHGEVAKGYLEERLVEALQTYYLRTYWDRSELEEVPDPLCPTIYSNLFGDETGASPAPLGVAVQRQATAAMASTQPGTP